DGGQDGALAVDPAVFRRIPLAADLGFARSCLDDSVGSVLSVDDRDAVAAAHQQRGHSETHEAEEGNEGGVARAVDHRRAEDHGSRSEVGLADGILAGELAAAIGAYGICGHIIWPWLAVRARAVRGKAGGGLKPV